MKKKITALVLVVAVVAMLFTGMTLAYFTDTDSAVNVFTVGDVDIELDETVGVTDSNGNPAPDRVTETETGATYTGIMPGNTLDKKVTVTNLENPAYVRVVVIVNNHLEIWKALDCYPGTETDMTADEKNANYTEVFTNWGITFTDTQWCGGVIPESHLDGQGGVEVLGIDTAIRIADYTLYDSDNYMKSDAEINDPNADECLENYMDGEYAPHLNSYERVYVYYLAMDKGESLTLFDGLYCPTWFDQEQAEMFNGLNIELYAAAIQQEGFATPEDAFEQLDKEFPISDMRAAVNPPVVVTSADDLIEALNNGEENIILGADIHFDADDLTVPAGSSYSMALAVLNDTVLDLNGHDITASDAATAVVYVHNADLTIKGEGNLTVSGNNYLIWAKGASTVSIEGGNYYAPGEDSSVFYASGNTAWDPKDDYATINVYGGTFTSDSVENQDYANVMNHGVGKINYYGGTFDWHPENNVDADDAAHINVAEGYTVQDNGNGTYTVVPNP